MLVAVHKVKLICDWPNCRRSIDVEYLEGMFKLPEGWRWHLMDLTKNYHNEVYCPEPTHQ